MVYQSLFVVDKRPKATNIKVNIQLTAKKEVGMTATFHVGYTENLSVMTINDLVQGIRGYGKKAERTPSEYLQELKTRTDISFEQVRDIHKALLAAYDVLHANQIDLQPAIIATVNRLAKNNHSFSDQMMIPWVEKGLYIVGDNQSGEYLTSAAISLLNSQFKLVRTLGNIGKKVELNGLGSISQVHDNRVDFSKNLLVQCIDLMNHRDSGISSAATSLLNKQWDDLSQEQQEIVIERSINLIDEVPAASGAALNLINHHLLPEDDRNEMIANKSIQILLTSDNNSQRVSAAQCITRFIKASSAPVEKKANVLGIFARSSRNSHPDKTDEIAIFTEALQTLGAQAGGSYSQTRIATQPSVTNGHGRTWPASAADSQTAPRTCEAALARGSR
jgi:hypothetical protein